MVTPLALGHLTNVPESIDQARHFTELSLAHALWLAACPFLGALLAVLLAPALRTPPTKESEHHARTLLPAHSRARDRT